MIECYFVKEIKLRKVGITFMKKQAFNPYLPSWEYIPDGEPYVFNGRVYVYGSHDFYNGYVFCMGDYVCWSAPVDDLGNWRYEGKKTLNGWRCPKKKPLIWTNWKTCSRMTSAACNPLG